MVKNTKVYIVLGLTICVTGLILAISGFVLWRDVFNFDKPVIGDEVQIPIIALPNTEVEVVAVEEKTVLPFTVKAKKVVLFFDKNLQEDQANQAIVEYEGVYRPSLGTVYTYDGKAFDAVAMNSGTVEKVYDDALLGKTIILKCKNASIYYQGLNKSVVKEGDVVKQGDVLGVAGNSVYHENLGIHMLVSAKVNNQYVNIESLIK